MAIMILGLPLIVIFVLGLFFWGMKNPLIWMIMAVLAIAVGIGLFAAGVTSATFLGEHPVRYEVDNVAMLIGFGAGGTAGGVILLAVSLVRVLTGGQSKTPV